MHVSVRRRGQVSAGAAGGRFWIHRGSWCKYTLRGWEVGGGGGSDPGDNMTFPEHLPPESTGLFKLERHGLVPFPVGKLGLQKMVKIVTMVRPSGGDR